MEDLYNPYLQTDDSPRQSRTIPVEAPAEDRERTVRASHSSIALDSQKNSNKDWNAARRVWMFTWSDIVDYILQTVGIIAGVVFGVWAIRSYYAMKTSLAIATAANSLSTQAVEQSLLANRLELLAFCAPIQAGSPSNFTELCSQVSPEFLSSVIKAVNPANPSPSFEGLEKMNFTAVVFGTIIGVIVLFQIAAAAFFVGRKRLRISLVEDNC